MEKEIWKSIEGYEGLYEVSSLGRFKGLKRVVTYNNGRVDVMGERIMKIISRNDGYRYMNLSKDKKQKVFKAHRLIAKAFIPNPENKSQINHINGIKHDNRLENLEWCTPSENAKHAFRIGLKKPLKQIPGGINHKSTSKPIKQYTLSGEYVKTFPSISEVYRQLGFRISAVAACANGKGKTAFGYKWVFAELIEDKQAA